MDLRVFFYRRFVVEQGREKGIAREFLKKNEKNGEKASEGGMRQTEGARVDGEHRPLQCRGRAGYKKAPALSYRECRGEHCSPANLVQQGFSGKALHIARGHGRAMLAPTEFYNGRMIYKQ